MRGIVRAVSKASLSSDLGAPILSIRFREGERFAKGEVIIEFDCRRHFLELDALAAVTREAKVLLDANQHLVKRGAASRTEVETSTARFEKAEAEWKALRQRLDGCGFIAPWPGVVTELRMHAHETPPSGKPFMTIVSDRDLEIELIAPSRLLAQVKPSSRMKFVIDETGRNYAVQVLRTGGAVDPMSQTVKLFATIVGADDDVVPGMSGAVRFELAAER